MSIIEPPGTAVEIHFLDPEGLDQLFLEYFRKTCDPMSPLSKPIRDNSLEFIRLRRSNSVAIRWARPTFEKKSLTARNAMSFSFCLPGLTAGPDKQKIQRIQKYTIVHFALQQCWNHRSAGFLPEFRKFFAPAWKKSANLPSGYAHYVHLYWLHTEQKELKMAHSLFEPEPEPIRETVFRRIKRLQDWSNGRANALQDLEPEFKNLDARGQQTKLLDVLKSNPLKK